MGGGGGVGVERIKYKNLVLHSSNCNDVVVENLKKREIAKLDMLTLTWDLAPNVQTIDSSIH